ncbi:MAG: hypothetical protein JRJ84_25995 [Deltaproteobacteria bacterium]|nr:hypothetical protein [Deltaproteobacteria bacterium]
MKPACVLAGVFLSFGCNPEPQGQDLGEEGPQALTNQEQILAKKKESDCPGVDSIGNDLEHGHPNGFDVEGVVGCLDSCVGMIAGLEEMGEDNKNYDCHLEKVEAMQKRCQTMYDGLTSGDQEEVQKLAPEDLEECLDIVPSGDECEAVWFCNALGDALNECPDPITMGTPTQCTYMIDETMYVLNFTPACCTAKCTSVICWEGVIAAQLMWNDDWAQVTCKDTEDDPGLTDAPVCDTAPQ